MRRNQIKQSFTQLADGALDIKAMTVLKALQGNVHFPDLLGVALLEESINQFHDAIKKAGNRGRAEIAEKNKIRQQIVSALQQLAEKVGLTAGGDRTKLLSSSFDLARNGTAQTIIDAPELLHAKNGINPGDMIVKVKANRKARGYNHE